ncbi:MAG: hypothetical protein AMXMBFR82_48160 [Candidatus Hydrogenedentota bacterium]
MSRPTLRLFDGFGHTSPELRDEVRDLQVALTGKGYALEDDGLFGRETEMMVKRFQQDQRLDDDGIAGRLTWNTLLDFQGAGGDCMPETRYPRNFASLLPQLDAAGRYRQWIEAGARDCGVSPAIVCGIGSRESDWGFGLTPVGPAGTGDRSPRSRTRPFRPGRMPPDGEGFGRGLMQIDFDAHEFARTGNWRDPEANIRYGCNVLKSNLALMRRRTPLEGTALLRAAIAAYNCGGGNVLTAIEQGRDVDYFTAHRDYSREVLNRAGWFGLHGWD